MVDRENALEKLAAVVATVQRVAIDGVDAAGKTILANELAQVLEQRGQQAKRGSIDDFHRPEAERYRRGYESPEGYYQDSFDYEAARRWISSSGQGVLLFDGIFLMRPELNDLWDLRIFVDVDREEAVRRAVRRDAELWGSEAAARRRYRVFSKTTSARRLGSTSSR